MTVPPRLVLDTSAYAHMRAGTGSVHEAITDAELVLFPVIVLGELEAGFRGGRRTVENRAMLAEFLAEPFCAVLPVTEDVARIYGQLFIELRSAGTPVATNDVWIAACAIGSGAHLLTFDADFKHFSRLDCTILSA
jgi:tRNA(fMet)-specific endonuclease VapC